MPGHTGKGADFRLAEMKVGDYPGIYHMVEIPPEDWHLLPPVLGKDSINLDMEAEDRLEKAGYIIGKMQRVIFHEPGIKDTNWSATATVTGVDATVAGCICTTSRGGQPSINWLDLTSAGMHTWVTHCTRCMTLGPVRSGWMPTASSVWRRVARAGAPAWSEGHPRRPPTR